MCTALTEKKNISVPPCWKDTFNHSKEHSGS